MQRPTSCSRRSAVTLVETLVAIFVMGLGLITLLALFPLGALTMAQAIRDERCAAAAQNAAALATALNLRHMISFPGNPPPDGPGYPVYVDPLGVYSYVGNQNQWLAGARDVIPRISLSPYYIASYKKEDALRLFTLLDDIHFDKQGLPNYIGPNQFERDNLYSWAYLLRRPMQANSEVVNLTVVVYNNRPLSLNSLFQGGETAYSAVFDPTNNIVTVSGLPNLRIGDWILDASTTASPTNPNAPPHATFYRVVGISQTGAASLNLEVQPPLRDFPIPTPQGYNGQIFVLEGVAEVFEKGPGWKS
jgi:hypothetical protein